MDHQQLLKAARSGEVEQFKQLVDGNPHLLVAAVSPQRNTALHMTARFGHSVLVKEILNHQPSLLFQVNLDNKSPMHFAASAGHADVVKSLIDYASEIGNIETGSKEKVYEILRMRDNKQNTALHGAVRNRWFRVVKILVQEDPELLLLVNIAGESPLSIAIDARSNLTVNTIIEANPSSLLHRGANGQTPLHCAILRNDEETMKAILKEKMELVKEKDRNQWSPLHYAAALGTPEIVEHLLSYDSSIVYQGDNNQQTPVHLAAANGQFKVLAAILSHCPDSIHLLDNKQQNALHLAAQNGRAGAVFYILKFPEMEDLVNAPDEDGNTPLHLSAMNFRHDIVHILIENPRLDIWAINNAGQTALDIVNSVLHFQTPSVDIANTGLADDPELEFRKNLTLKALVDAGKGKAQNLQDRLKGSLYHNVGNKITIERSKKIAETLTLMATLVATVTFTAAFTVPGGYKNNSPDEGMATLARKSAFQAFVITDAIAMISSMSAAVLVFWLSWWSNDELFTDTLVLALNLTKLALATMGLAFVTGLFVVLSKSMWLAIAVCVVGCAFPAYMVNKSAYFQLVSDLSPKDADSPYALTMQDVDDDIPLSIEVSSDIRMLWDFLHSLPTKLRSRFKKLLLSV